MVVSNWIDDRTDDSFCKICGGCKTNAWKLSRRVQLHYYKDYATQSILYSFHVRSHSSVGYTYHTYCAYKIQHPTIICVEKWCLQNPHPNHCTSTRTTYCIELWAYPSPNHEHKSITAMQTMQVSGTSMKDAQGMPFIHLYIWILILNLERRIICNGKMIVVVVEIWLEQPTDCMYSAVFEFCWFEFRPSPQSLKLKAS